MYNSQEHKVEQSKTEAQQILYKSNFVSSKTTLNKTRMYKDEQ